MQILPLSKAQQRIWLDAQLIPDSPAYNNPLLYRLTGKLNVGLLKQALQSIVDSQPALRCYFIQQNGIPKQILVEKVEVKLEYHDLSNIAICDQPKTIDNIKHDNVQISFDLSTLPLFRFTLIKCSELEYLFILNIHHIVVDGYSASLLIQHISNYYNEQQANHAKLDDIYIHQLTKPAATSSQTFWLNELQDAHFSIDLYAENPHTQKDNGIREHFSINNDLTQKIKSLAREYKTTDFIVLMSAFFVTLARYTSQYDLTIGYAVDTRSSDCKNLFGFFVNNIPLRLQFSPQNDFQTILKLLTQKRKAIKSHQLYDYFDIICDIRQHVSSVTQLYSTSFIRANFALTGLQLHGIEVTALPIYTGAVKDDIALLYDENKNFEFEIEYRSEKYRSDLIQMIKKSYIQLLNCVTQKKNIPIYELDVFTTHLNKLIFKNYKTDTLIARVKRYAITQGQHIAIRTKEEEISYQTLYEHVQLLSAQLAVYQLNREKPVIVLLERKPSLVKTLLALQWLGLTYIPLDVNTPNERIKTIISESETSAVIVENEEPHYDCRVIKLNDLSHTHDFIAPIKGELSYIIYTSGSTGKPKGVAIYSEALHHFLECMQQQLMLQNSDCLLAITTIAFDISALELFLPLWSGSSLYLANQQEYKDPFAITKLLDDASINILQATPAMWTMLFAAGWKGKKTLTALCGGEALTTALASELLENVYKLWNMYGPTEATIWCAVKEISDANKISIGHAISNMQFYILDEQQNILPAYVKGELCIAGIGLAKGYYHRDDLTKQQFIYHGEIQQRLYRTGDVACITDSGEIILYGRKDNQVKLNGYRIELGEIEAQLIHQAAVKQAAVIINKNQLIAYIVLNTQITGDEIHQELKNILPDYMLPAKYIFLESFPLSNSGKIDRKTLAKQEVSDEKLIILPYTALERILHTRWRNVLQTEMISTTDHFYAVGGHSLLATQIIAELQLNHQIAFSIADFFRYPSIQSAAKFIEANQATMKLIGKHHQNSYPLTNAQKRFWFLSQFIKDSNQFNMSGYLHIKGKINSEQLKRALHVLMKQHVVLRCTISTEGDETTQAINELANLPLDCINAISFTAALSLLHAFANKSFTMLNNLLWRALLIEINSDECLLGFSFHHIIMDGSSIKILTNDLWHAYSCNNDSAKQTLQIKDTISFFDYAQWENEQTLSENKINFWIKLLNNTPYLRLPPDINHTISSGEYQWQDIHWSNIQNFCKQISIAPATYLIACFARLLQTITGLNEFCIGIPHAARNVAQTEYLVGCFIDLIPLKISMPDNISFEHWLLQLQNHVQTCIQHAIPFLNLLEQPSIARDDVQMPIFSVALNIQPQVITQQHFSDFSFDLQYIANESSKYDLTLNLYFSEDGLNGQCEYNSSKFAANTIKKWCNDYQELLQTYLTSPKLVLQRLALDPVVIQEAQPSSKITNITQTPLHTELAACWQYFLNINHINLNDNFFTLGGHSLLATKIVAALNKQLNIAIPLETIFFKPIFFEFCNAVQNIISHSQTNSSTNYKNSDVILLTPNQQQLALLYSHQINDAYHLGVLIELPNAINISQLQTKIESVLSRHDVYSRRLSKNLQFITSHNPKVELEMMICNPPENKENLCEILLRQPFNLYESPLYRFAVIEENKKSYLAIVMHHLISDGWSLELLTNEILSTENHLSEMQTNSFSSINFNNEDLQFWRDYLFDRLPSLLPSSKQINHQTSIAKRLKYQLPAELLRECQSLSKEHGVSLYIIYLAIYLIHLKYFINEQTIFIATAYDRRNTQDRQYLHGYFVNLIPIIVDFSKIQNLSDLISYLNNDRNNSLQHTDLDFASLLSNNITYTPHIIFNFQHNFKLQSDKQNLQWQEINASQAKFPLVFNLRNLESQIECVIEYNTDYYEEDYVNHCFSGFLNLLNYLPENKAKPIAAWRLTNELSSTTIASNINEHLCKKLQKISQNYPYKTALVFNDKSLTYADLWDKVQHLAQAIHNYRGEQTNQTIAVVMNNSDEYVITILAILTLGANFLPIDITLPIARQEQIIADANAAFVITNQDELSNNYLQLHTLMSAESYDSLIERRGDETTPETQLAYIIYTSGTTGKPKGVPITQQQLTQFISALANELAITQQDSILQFSSISFDASIWEIFLALLTGASLVIPNQKQRLVGSNLQNFMTTHKITHAILTPSVIKTLDANKSTSLRSLVSGGEACTAELVTAWAEKVAFYNAYGPTEATVCTNLHRFTIKDKPTIIGKALGKNELTIISEYSQILPAGAIGELIIGGDSITSGYLQRPELNKEKFIYLNNHSELKRYYRTGDLVRKLDHQVFEYVGRIDQQVKLRGLRIELGEIEAIIKEWGTQDALCQVKDNILLAYVIDQKTIDSKILLTHLAQTLPPYMVPQHIIQISDIPLTTSGKIDYRKLPDMTHNHNEVIAPRNELEQAIYDIWQRFLSVNPINITQNFFELGGNSLQAMQIVAHIEEHFKIEMSLSEFYSEASIEQQALFIATKQEQNVYPFPTNLDDLTVEELELLHQELSQLN